MKSNRPAKYRRYELIFEMERLYLERPYSDSELGKRLETGRENIFYIRKMMTDQMHIPIEPFPGIRGKYHIRPDYNLRQIRFTSPQMVALYLAGRRMQQQTRTSLAPVADMLSKVANALRKPLAEELTRAAAIILDQEQDERERVVFETLVECWLEQIPVRIRHHVLHGIERQYYVHPYQLEPAIWGDGIYLIGYSEYHKGIATFKTTRITKAVKGIGQFEIPVDFNSHLLLKNAWGIWHADREPVTVRLHFNRWVAPRVQESIWHPQQLIKKNSDGTCDFTVQVAEWHEMVAWIRGWGSDVMVIEPAEMKGFLRQEARRLARNYGVSTQSAPLQPIDAIAHTKNVNGKRHNLIDHLHAVAQLAERFAQPFGGGALARCLGLWHDIGKFHPEFQEYLLNAEDNPKRKRRGPDHKAAGATIAHEQKLSLASLLIQGHHGGLRSKEEFKRWHEERKEAAEEAIALARQTSPDLFQLPPGSPQALFPSQIAKDAYASEFFLRFVFSALTDADFLDTEQHFSPERSISRGAGITIEELWQRLDKKQRNFIAGAEKSPVNQLRQEIYAACVEAASHAPGLFRLTVPTGGGKTRSGLAFALRHAKQHGLRRVIIAVPFITITEQTTNVYRSILELETDTMPIVLEHHSSAVENASEDEYTSKSVWTRLAAENWDAPIIVTTTVQLFESMFANGTSRCRKLHRLAGSVIVLDEAQALPTGLLDPILSGLRELCSHYGSSVVLSTATQPAFEINSAFRNISATEIVANSENYFHALSRVEYEWRVDEQQTWDEVARWMRVQSQVLAIVNTKKDAIALLGALDDPNALHLSTLLCGAHRREVIGNIKQRLNNGETCRLVATQVVEAGVDIDFPLVLRAFGPLDSIIQAAGRANREGKMIGKGHVIIFDPVDGGSPRGSYHIAKETTRTLLAEGPPNMDDPESVAKFFRLYYPLDVTDRKKIQPMRENFDYSEVARNFRMIDDKSVNVVVEYGVDRDETLQLLERLRNGWGNRRTLLRQLQPYIVSLRERQAREYLDRGFISPVLVDDNDQLLVGQWHGEYDSIRGLSVGDPDLDKFVI